MAHSDIRADNSTLPAAIIKPALKVEVSCSVILHNPQGLTTLDTNARSVSDFDQNGTGAKFFTTCLHSDISKLRYRLADHSAAERAIKLINIRRSQRLIDQYPEKAAAN